MNINIDLHIIELNMSTNSSELRSILNGNSTYFLERKRFLVRYRQLYRPGDDQQLQTSRCCLTLDWRETCHPSSRIKSVIRKVKTVWQQTKSSKRPGFGYSSECAPAKRGFPLKSMTWMMNDLKKSFQPPSWSTPAHTEWETSAASGTVGFWIIRI